MYVAYFFIMRTYFCCVDLNTCRNNPCANGATCNNTGPDMYNCTCAPGFTGSLCGTG